MDRAAHIEPATEAESMVGDQPDAASAADLATLYESLYLIRRVEEEIIRLYPTDKIKSPVHLSIGQEAVAVALCSTLRPSDTIYATYRGHAAYLAKGGDLPAMWAELYGKAAGCGRGKAGSMHLVDTSVGMMGTSAIVASSIPNAVGHALAARMQRRSDVTVAMFGEGATDEGAFHESLNFASLHGLPILFLCENNEYAIYSHVAERMAGPGLIARAESYGIRASRIADGSIFSMRDACAEAVGAVRAGRGPRFLEIMTQRWRDHVGPGEDRHYGYRPLDRLEAAIAGDQVARVAGMLGPLKRRAIETRVEAAIAEAIAAAEAAPFPAPEEVYEHVFAA